MEVNYCVQMFRRPLCVNLPLSYQLVNVQHFFITAFHFILTLVCLLTYSNPYSESNPGQKAEFHHEEYVDQDAGTWSQWN